MRKALVILFVVAALGILATYIGPNPFKDNDKETLSMVSESVTPSATSTSPTSSSVATSPTATATPTTTASSGYKDGSYTGSLVSNRYGDVQVSISVSGGKITDVSFLSMPFEADHSSQLSDYAKPKLKSQTLAAQSASIAGVSGATYTSMSYRQSLQSAIDKAKS